MSPDYVLEGANLLICEFVPAGSPTAEHLRLSDGPGSNPGTVAEFPAHFACSRGGLHPTMRTVEINQRELLHPYRLRVEGDRLWLQTFHPLWGDDVLLQVFYAT